MLQCNEYGAQSGLRSLSAGAVAGAGTGRSGVAFSDEEAAAPRFHASGAGCGERPDKVLIVLHGEHSSPGRIGQRLAARGFRLDVRKPRFGDPLPATMTGHAGAVVFGGPMSANDSDAFVRREIDWIRVPLKEEKPFLGICLGAQMLARQCGARVAPHPGGLVEVGYYPITPTACGNALLPWPEHVYHWHGEGFDLPAGANLLAAGEAFPHQAMQVGRAAYGIQFHPELTLAMVHRWTARASRMAQAAGARAVPTHFRDRLTYDAAVLCWLERFLDLWIGPPLPVERRVAVSASAFGR